MELFMEMFTTKNSFVNTLVEKAHILLVEDDILNKELITIYLRNICTIDHAPDGLKAIELSKHQAYSLILMDINLGPGINGIETAKRIKTNGYSKNTPIIAVTAFAMSGDRDRLLAEGFDHYLSKPFQKKELVELVRNVLLVECNA